MQPTNNTPVTTPMALIPLFKGLSDPVRLRIIHLLIVREVLCVCHLTDTLNLPQSTISRHLTTLKHANLVVAERRGQWVYYHLASAEENAEITAIIDIIRVSAAKDLLLQQDLANLKATLE